MPSFPDDSKERGESSSRRKHGISYAAERVIETGETVAIKKVLQDRRFKNRELQIMRTLDHPCVVRLKNSFLSKGDKVRVTLRGCVRGSAEALRSRLIRGLSRFILLCERSPTRSISTW